MLLKKPTFLLHWFEPYSLYRTPYSQSAFRSIPQLMLGKYCLCVIYSLTFFLPIQNLCKQYYPDDKALLRSKFWQTRITRKHIEGTDRWKRELFEQPKRPCQRLAEKTSVIQPHVAVEFHGYRKCYDLIGSLRGCVHLFLRIQPFKAPNEGPQLFIEFRF